MPVTVEIPTVLRGLTDGERTVTAAGADLAAAISDVDNRHDGFADRLLDAGELRRFINIYVNDEDVRFLDGLKTTLADGDVVTVLPAVAGG